MTTDRKAFELIAAGVPMVKRTLYADGQPTETAWMACTYEKRGIFHYLNGKRVARNLLSLAT